MFGAVLDVLKQTAQRSGLLDSCAATGFTVSREATADGAYAVTSTAAHEFRAAELQVLAATLRADGYRVWTCQVGREPQLRVRVEASETGDQRWEPVGR